MSAPINNYLMQAINASVRIAFVIVPTMKAGTHLVELASRALNAALSVINIKMEMPKLIDPTAQPPQDGYGFGRRVYSAVHKFLPASITEQNDAFNKLSHTDVLKGAVFYTTVSIVSTFAANRLIGKMPEAYDTVSKCCGSILRFDRNYDLIQLGIDYFTKK